MTYDIKQAYLSALRTFEGFVTRITASDACELQVPISSWRDELGRVRLWGSNTRLYWQNVDSVEYRLRDSSHISNQVQKILAKLEKAIREAQNVVTEAAQDAARLEPGIDDEPDDDDDDGSTTDLQQLFQYIETLIRLSI